MLAERSDRAELMDAQDLDRATYIQVLHDLAQVNSVTMARRPTLNFLRRALDGRRTLRLLDVGFGDGDMLRCIARWTKKRGIAAQLTGVDLNPNSIAAARQATPADQAIEFITGDYADLGGKEYDIIISSLVAHHMSAIQLDAFLRFMQSEAKLGWFINDLHRHGFAYLGYPILARIMRWHPIVRLDGQLSIARAFRTCEWHSILSRSQIDNASVDRYFPFRLCVEQIR